MFTQCLHGGEELDALPQGHGGFLLLRLNHALVLLVGLNVKSTQMFITRADILPQVRKYRQATLPQLPVRRRTFSWTLRPSRWPPWNVLQREEEFKKINGDKSKQTDQI